MEDRIMIITIGHVKYYLSQITGVSVHELSEDRLLAELNPDVRVGDIVARSAMRFHRRADPLADMTVGDLLAQLCGESENESVS
jgi:hypothetical protein